MTESERAELRQIVVEQSDESRRLMEALVERVTSQVQVIAEGHALQVAKLDGISSVVTRNASKIETLTTEMAVVRRDVSDLKAGQTELRADVKELKTGQAELRADVNELKTGQAELRADVNELKIGQAELRADVNELKIGQTELRADVSQLKAGQDELRADVEELKIGQDELRADVSEFKQEFTGHRAQTAEEFKETRALIRLSYSELDGRLRHLEHEVGDLRARVDRIESHSST